MSKMRKRMVLPYLEGKNFAQIIEEAYKATLTEPKSRRIPCMELQVEGYE